MFKPSVAMVATHWTQSFENCRRSLHVNDFDYDVLGWGEVWGGWQWRIKQYINFLQTQSPNSIVILLDAYDSLVTRHSSEFIDTFLAFQRSVVVGCEWWCGKKENCGKVNQWWAKNGKRPAFRSKVNAGCVVGFAGVLLEIYTWILANNYTDDQLGLAHWIDAYGHDTVALDTGSALIYNGNILDGLKPSKSAFFQHFPGPLLKLGLMPLYNTTAQKTLGDSARKIYPTLVIDAALWLFVFTVIMIWVLRNPSKPYK